MRRALHSELVDLMPPGPPAGRAAGAGAYPFADINEAVADSRSGATIKPVLTF